MYNVHDISYMCRYLVSTIYLVFIQWYTMRERDNDEPKIYYQSSDLNQTALYSEKSKLTTGAGILFTISLPFFIAF